MKAPSKTASLRNNKEAILDLQLIGSAIRQGRLDDVFSLIKTNYSANGTTKAQMLISDIDEQIITGRNHKIDNINFVIKQVEQYSKFLRKNFNLSSRDYGYTADMILANISEEEFKHLAWDIQRTIKDAEEGKIFWPDNPKFATPMEEAFARCRKDAQDRIDAQ